MRVRKPSASVAWSESFQPPAHLSTDAWRLEPLHPRHAALDYAAWSSCRRRLLDELDWNGWPAADFSLEDNRADLADHYAEFVRREAYAYTILTGDRCVGCLYLEPWLGGAQLAFWLVDDWLPLAGEVIGAVLQWLAVWPFERVILPVTPQNIRAQSTLERLGLARCAGPEGHVSYCAHAQAP